MKQILVFSILLILYITYRMVPVLKNKDIPADQKRKAKFMYTIFVLIIILIVIVSFFVNA